MAKLAAVSQLLHLYVYVSPVCSVQCAGTHLHPSTVHNASEDDGQVMGSWGRCACS